MSDDSRRYLETQRPTRAEAERFRRRLRAESHQAPAESASATWVRPALWGLLAVATLLVVVRFGPEQSELIRGGTSAGPPVVHLQMLRAEGMGSVTTGGAMAIGESVLFRIEVDQDTTLVVWVEGPGGREPIVSTSAAAGVPVDLRLGEGLLAYEFEAAGRYRFYASTEADTCQSPSCMMRVVEVR